MLFDGCSPVIVVLLVRQVVIVQKCSNSHFQLQVYHLYIVRCLSPSAAVQLANSASDANPASCAAYGSVAVVGVAIIVVNGGGNSISR